jgi:peptide/nickel transport system ATP-binding protein/oligopeptide transport system ATP-binding protein
MYATDRCRSETPMLREVVERGGHQAACHYIEEISVGTLEKV